MDEEHLRSWAAQPDACRCCLSANGTWDMTASYVTDSGDKEVFSDMLQECYGITLSHLTQWGPSRMMCNLCVGQIRDAFHFKNKVIRADSYFNEYWNSRRSIKSETIEEKVNETNFLTEPQTDLGDDIVNGILSDDDKDKTLETKEQQAVDVDERKRKKTKRKTHSVVSDNDYDSDTPIASLLNIKDSNIKKEIDVMREGDVRGCNQKIGFKRKINPIPKCHSENRQIRSNISLILKNSNLTPFRHIKNKYVCLYCECGYLVFQQLRAHVMENHSSVSEREITSRLKTPKNFIKADISNIQCKLCNEKFKTIDSFIEHLTDDHKKVYFFTSIVPSHGILPFDLSMENFKCFVCSKEFRFFKNLSVHMNEHSKSSMCHICGKNFVSDHRLQTHVIMHKKTNIVCKICKKEFKSVSAMKYHVRKIHNEAKYKCTECKKEFSQPYHRLKHLVDCHKLKKPEFKCSFCGKELASSGGLSAHMRYSHLKNKQYPCEICGKIFFYKWIWQRHLDIHSGEKNYECKICNKKFAKPYTLEMHLRIHLNDKRFVCIFCKAAFIQKCSLKNHVRVHHPGNVDLKKV